MSHVVVLLAWYLTIWNPNGSMLLDGPFFSPAICEAQKTYWESQGRKVSECQRMQVAR